MNVVPGAGWPGLDGLLELTERALASGLEVALADLVEPMAAALGADGIAVHLRSPARGDYELVVRHGSGPAEVGSVIRAEEAGALIERDGPRRAAIRDKDGTINGMIELHGDVPLESAEPFAIAIASALRAVATRDIHEVNIDELRSLARHDDLTGVLNRRAFFERLDEELARARRTDETLTLVLCDVDHLKAINDERGHPAGDEALRAVTRHLESNVRTYDSVGRIGGDEFALILVGADAENADIVLERLDTRVELGGGVDDVQSSFGTARSPDDGTTRDALVAAADRRLYEAKRAGR